MVANPICLQLLRQEVCRAFSRACAKTGNRMAARMAMIAMTTSSSIRVKPFVDGLGGDGHFMAFSLVTGFWCCVTFAGRAVGGAARLREREGRSENMSKEETENRNANLALKRFLSRRETARLRTFCSIRHVSG